MLLQSTARCAVGNLRSSRWITTSYGSRGGRKICCGGTEAKYEVEFCLTTVSSYGVSTALMSHPDVSFKWAEHLSLEDLEGLPGKGHQPQQDLSRGGVPCPRRAPPSIKGSSHEHWWQCGPLAHKGRLQLSLLLLFRIAPAEQRTNKQKKNATGYAKMSMKELGMHVSSKNTAPCPAWERAPKVSIVNRVGT